jgi:hydroxyacylglutathione hydrolase
MATVEIIPTLKDNYTYAVRAGAEALVVDPGEAGPVREWCRRNGVRITAVVCTHHHSDHIGGVGELKAEFRCTVWTSAFDFNRIPGADRELSPAEPFHWQGLNARVIEIPGHTLGHVALYFADQRWLFCGDTLFTLGCGRLFEGTPEQMHASLSKLISLPAETSVFCGHEYTLRNAPFALHVDGANERLRERVRAAEELRAAGTPTVPSTLGEEIATNPFLRWNDPAIRARFGHGPDASDAEVFKSLRAAKDRFP